MGSRRPNDGQPRRTGSSGGSHSPGAHGAPRARRGAARPTSARGAAAPRSRRPSSGPASRTASEPSRRAKAPTGAARPYNAPAVWTKDAPRTSSRSAGDGARAVGGALLAGLSFLGRGLSRAGGAVLSLFKRSRIALAAASIVAAVLLVGLVDFGWNAGKAYPGVRVGEVDASGRTSEEIAALLEETYGPRVAQGSVVAYASEEAAAAGWDEADGPSIAEQQSAEEEKASRTSWTADAESLAATLPAAELAEQAVAVGREDGGLFARLDAALEGRDVGVHAAYGAEELEAFAASIDETIGVERVDFGFAVEGGVASVTEGSDGEMVDRKAIARELDAAFLSESGTGSFVAHAEYAPVRVDRQAAQAACDDVNAAIADGARFTSGGASWDADAAALGDWIVGVVEERGDGFALVASVDEALAKPSIVAFAKEERDDAALSVSFERSDDGSVAVRAQGMDEVPLAADTVAELDEALFGPEGKASCARAFAEGAGEAPASGPVEIPVAVGPMPETLTFDEALEWGVIEGFSSFTTEFSTGSGTQNRQHNIALVSQMLDNSVVEPGGRWSFNDTSGERTSERGFLSAGAIVNGEYSDEEGGGVCQVATTVFNAVYNAGLPVPKRYNHTLYIASYPEGRDAAVSWPDLDLVWENDTESAVLMRVTCAESSVTATLYGVDPGYAVSTRVGEWEEGEKHKTKRVVDESLSPGTSSVKTRGTDGRRISITRVVKDRAGNVLHEDEFSSEYAPITEVVVVGPDTPADDAPTSGPPEDEEGSR